MSVAPDLVPRRVRAAFAHAAVQQAADHIGVRVLHIKGVAVDEHLQSVSGGTDADVLVDPAAVGLLMAQLRAWGWELYSDFHTGSPFGHAATLQHEHWGFADLHRFFPGMHQDPAHTFEVLWTGRQRAQIAGMPCAVPSTAGQALVLILNNLRNGRGTADPRIEQVRTDAESWAQVEALVPVVQAQVAFDAAFDRLEAHHGAGGEYWMWKVTTEGGSRSAEWLARVRAAPTWQAKASLVLRTPLVNTETLTHRLGREPTRAEVAREFVHRGARGAAEARTAIVRRLGRRSS